MPCEDKCTNTEHVPRKVLHPLFCGLTGKDLLQIISQLLLPLLLAVFTIVITFDQRKENRIQRADDRYLAEEQRLQDLNISRDQRENDKWIAEQQRQHDKQIAIDKRLADDFNADVQRNMTRDQRMYEITVEQERYRKENEKYLDALLLSYYNEMGELFQRTNGNSLAIDQTIFSLARAKTLNVIEQVGPVRAVHLVMFLYGAGQLTIDNKSLDLTEASLNNIDLRTQRTLRNVHLSGAHLRNAFFDGQDVSNANFRGAQLVNASFRGAICIGTLFDDAHLVGVDFSYANITNASFMRSNLQTSIFHKATANDLHFAYTRIQDADFSDVHFNCNSITSTGFIDSNLARSDFRRAHLIGCRFAFCDLTHVDFTDADLQRANMTGSSMSYALFDNADLGYTRLWSTNLSHANLTTIRCSGTIRNISSCKLGDALTLEDAHMPDKSLGLASALFLTVKDRPHCQQHVLGQTFPLDDNSQWRVKPSHSVFNQYRLLNETAFLDFSACVFVPMKTSGKVEMTQRFSLTHHTMLIETGRAKLAVICLVGYDAHIILTELNKQLKPIRNSEVIVYRWSELLDQRTTTIEVTLQFFNALSDVFSWSSSIEIYIEADIRAPDTQLLHPWGKY